MVERPTCQLPANHPPFVSPPPTQVQAAWRTDEIRRQKPTPQDEMRHGLSYFQQTIIDSLPVFMRR
jgi:phosphoenolpyruvate carboxylase